MAEFPAVSVSSTLSPAGSLVEVTFAVNVSTLLASRLRSQSTKVTLAVAEQPYVSASKETRPADEQICIVGVAARE